MPNWVEEGTKKTIFFKGKTATCTFCFWRISFCVSYQFLLNARAKTKHVVTFLFLLGVERFGLFGFLKKVYLKKRKKNKISKIISSRWFREGSEWRVVKLSGPWKLSISRILGLFSGCSRTCHESSSSAEGVLTKCFLCCLFVHDCRSQGKSFSPYCRWLFCFAVCK